MTRCQEVLHVQSSAVQRLLLLIPALRAKITAGVAITHEDVDLVEAQTGIIADALKRCR